jgi:hypothetical protein
MKNFDEIEQLWRQQTVVVSDSAPAIRAVQTAADRVVKSRRRRLRLGVGVTIFSLIVTQLLAVVNFLYGGRTPNAIALAHLGVLQVIQILILIGLLRRIRAEGKLRAKSGSSVRENLTASLELIEREMRDFRWIAPAFVLLFLFEAIPLWNGYHLGYFDQAGLMRRLAAVAVFLTVVGSVAQRHARRVLGPRRQELTTVLAELDEE